MFDKMRIKEHMEVTDSTGRHLGTVDSVKDDKIKLTKNDAKDGMHHFIPIDQLDKVEDNRLYLRSGAMIPEGLARQPATA